MAFICSYSLRYLATSMWCIWLLCLLVTVVVGAPSEDNAQGKKWAVIAAGSNEWWNYNDQASISHTYQVLHRHGIPDENIIVFMYDDIANNPENPTPGILINKPNGTDVYKGVKKDYVKDNVTPAKFLAVLTGDKKTAGAKVLESGPNDHVFVYFADHGGPNFMCFPDSDLHADDLINALKTMHKKKMYKKLLFYLDTCYSGSIFEGKLPKNINVVAFTSANPDESAYNTYCDTTGYPCLSSDMAAGWLEKTDKDEGSVLAKESLGTFYKAIVERCKKGGYGGEISHPKTYGHTQMANNLIKDFIGVGKEAVSNARENIDSYGQSVSVQETYLHYLNQKIKLANDEEVLQDLRAQKSSLFKGRKMIDELFYNIMSHFKDADDVMNTRTTLYMEEMSCYKTLVENFRQQCVNTSKNTYTLRHLGKLANLCARDVSPEHVLDIFSTECTEQHRQLNRVN